MVLATFFLLFFAFLYTARMQYHFIPSSEIDPLNLTFWQSQIWSDILKDSSQVQDIFYYGNTQSTYLLIEIRTLGLGFLGAFALGVSRPQIGRDYYECISRLEIYLRDKNILFLQIEPIEDLWIMNHESWVIKKPYKKFLTPYTRIIDLTQTEDAVFAQMHEKWRYSIRVAQKKWVQIERVDATQEHIDIWMGLLNETLSRDGFSGNIHTYYEIFISRIANQWQWWLYFARFEWRVIAAGIFVFTMDRAIYYYGASSSDSTNKKLFAPYLLQWEIMKVAKSQWLPWYDLLGVSKPGDEKDTLAWVSFFKSRFGWEVVELPQTIVRALSWKYRVFLVLQSIKNLLKRR